MREQTSQACDACRLRKARCQTNFGTIELADPTRTCQRCEKLAIRCTFDLPVQRRGPKGPRKRKLSPDTDDQIAPSTNNEESFANDTVQSDQGSSLPRSSTVHTDTSFATKPSPNEQYSPTWIRTPGSDAQSTGKYDALIRPPVSRRDSRHLPSIAAQWHSSSLLYATDGLCDRDTLRRIIDDYVVYIYPAIPVFHLQTFQKAFDLHQDSRDTEFFGLLGKSSSQTILYTGMLMHDSKLSEILRA